MECDDCGKELDDKEIEEYGNLCGECVREYADPDDWLNYYKVVTII